MTAHERVIADCRLFPSQKNCGVTIAGSEEEVMRLAVRHAVEEHGHSDTAELRHQIHEMLSPEQSQAHA
jgi:predicted small metal-binding protein